MLLDDLAIFIASASTSYVVGTNVFKGYMPETPNTAITVYENPGLAPEWALGGSAPIRERPRIQVIVRSTSYQTARSHAETVHKKLDRGAINSTSVSSSGPRYLRIAAAQQPFPLARDANERIRIACNYDIEKERS